MEREQDAWFYGLSAAAGFLAGLRSVAGPAAVSTALERAGMADDADPIVATAARFAPGVRVLALAEMAADKLPMMPDRISPPALAGRIILGAFSGVLLAQALRRDPVVAALVAGLAAIGGAYLGFRLRMATSEGLGAPSQVVGLAEDVAVFGGAQVFVGQAEQALAHQWQTADVDDAPLVEG